MKFFLQPLDCFNFRTNFKSLAVEVLLTNYRIKSEKLFKLFASSITSKKKFLPITKYFHVICN